MDTNNPTPAPTRIERQPAPPAREPIREGLAAHLKRIDALIGDIGQEIAALQRIEKALKDCHDRLDRQGGLIVMETQLVEQLIKRDAPKPPVTPAIVRGMPIDKLADRVEDDLKRLADIPATADIAPSNQPMGFVPKR